MALTQFRDEQADPKVNITKRMFAPTKASNLEYWWKACRKVIPQIPDPKAGEWEIIHTHTTVDYIRFSLVKVGDFERRCYVVVDRVADSLGGA